MSKIKEDFVSLKQSIENESLEVANLIESFSSDYEEYQLANIKDAAYLKDLIIKKIESGVMNYDSK